MAIELYSARLLASEALVQALPELSARTLLRHCSATAACRGGCHYQRVQAALWLRAVPPFSACGSPLVTGSVR
eukprot:8744237-Alexandrium_andersonii.AAC.1